MSDILESLKVVLSGDLDALRRDLRAAKQETERAGDLASKSFGDAFKRQSMGDLFNKQEFAQQGRMVGQQAGREAARGFDQSFQQNAQQATAGTAGLGTQFMALRGTIAAATAAAAAWTGNQMVQQLVGLAKEAQAAENAQTAFERSVRRSGQSVSEASGLVEQLADKYGASSTQAMKAAETLIRNGASLQQVQQAFTAVGASAAREGKNIGEAWEQVGTAIVTSRSELVESYGLITNFGPVQQAYAKSIGKTVEALTDQERITANVNAILKETKSEVQDQDIYLQGLTRSENENIKAKKELRDLIGGQLKPAITALMDEQARALKSATDWARANKDTLEVAIRNVAVAIVDAGGAIRVLLGLMADSGKAAGGLGTILVGFGLAVGGGLKGGIEAALTEIKRLFSTSMDSLIALQKAWGQFKQGDFSGAWKTVQEAVGNNMAAMRAAPGNIAAGAQQGAQWGVEAMKAGAEDVLAFGQATTTAASAADAASTRIRGALDGLVQGQELVAGLGLEGRRRGAPYGNRYLNGKYIHNGEDYFAPTGTPLYAPFTGEISTRYSKTTGNIVEMLDATGNKILVGHLARFAAGLQEAIKRAGGKLMVKGGTLVGYVGETGSMANITGAKNNDHAHVMAYNAQGQEIDPLKASFRGFDARSAWEGPDRLVRTGLNTPPPPSESPISAAQIVKAQQLLQAIEKAQDALKKKPGDVGLTKALDTATQSMKGWSEASKENARALAAVRSGQDGVNKSSGTYIATAADLKKYGGDALRLFKDLEKARESGSAQQVATAERNVATWIGESKARQAVFTAEGAALKVREQQREEARQAIKKDGDEMADAAAKWAAEQDARAREQAQIRARIADQNRQLTVSAAQVTAARLAELNRQELAAFKGNATQKAALIQRQSQDEYEARVRVLAAIRNKEIREAQNRTGLPEATRNEMIQQAKDRFTDGVNAAKGARLDTTRNTAQAIRDEAEAARREGEQTAADAARWAEEQETRDRERAQLLNRLANERRDLDVATARASLARIEELNKQELAAFKGTGAQRLAIVKRQAQEEYDARVAAADVARRVALEKSANEGGRNQGTRDTGIEAAYTQAELSARGTRDAAIQQATEQQAATIRTLRGEYSKLAESIRDRVAAGTFDAEAQQEATAAFNLLGRSAHEAGLYSNEYVEGARKSTWATIQTGDAARLTAEELEALSSQLEASSQAHSEAVKGPIALAESLDNLGDREAAIALLNATLDDLRAQAAAGGEDVSAAFDSVTEALDRLNASVDNGALERARTFLANMREEADRLAEATDRAADASLTEKDFADRDTVQGLAKGGASSLTGFLTGGDFFGSRFWTELGEEGREKFRAEVGKLESADFAVLGEETIRSFIAAIGDDEEWAPLKKLLVGRLQQIQQDFYQGISGQGFAGFKLPNAKNLNGPDSQNMQMPGGQAQNVFSSFSDQLWGMGDALKDPLRLDAVSKDLQDAYEAGKLTATQLNILKEIIASINAAPLELAPTADETRFEGVVKQFDDLTASLEAGEISLEEYSNQAGPLSVKLDRLAVAAQAANKPELAQAYAMLAAQLRNLMPVLDGTATKLEKFNKYADYVSQLGGAFQQFGQSLGGNLGANLAGFGKALNLVVDVAKDIATGNYIGAAIKVIGSLIEAIGGFRKANREALEKQKAFNEQFTFLNGDDYAKTFVKSRGFFADTFGGGPEVKQEVDKVGLLFAKSIEGGFSGGIKSGLKEAISKNDFSLFSKTLKESVYDGILEGIVDAFINGELLKGIIAPAIKAWSDALKTPGTEDDMAALAGIDAAVSQVDSMAQRFYSDVAPRIQGLGEKWGIDQGGQAGAGQSGSLFGNAPGVQLGIPRIEVTLPDSLMRPLGEFATAVPILSAASTTMLQAAQLLLRLGTGNGNPPPLSGNGAL